MHKLTQAAVIASLTVLGSSGAALAEKFSIYDCTFKVSVGAFLSESFTLFVSEESDQAFAMDGVIHFAYGEPIEVGATETDAKIVARWRVDLHDANGHAAKMDYRFAYLKNNGRATISATAVRYANKDQAHGRCTHAQKDLTG